MCIRDSVREWTKGIRTQHLEYEAYIPMAEKKLAQIGKEIEEKWPGTITTIVHRIGPLQISCLLYTSDAADDMQCGDLGGRRIREKKKS
ncbi:Molybdopterin synthase catalytic subunit [Clostridioides difficile]|nr:Molybdopterin synthase catalytic subunit [Clostridioides difficile]